MRPADPRPGAATAGAANTDTDGALTGDDHDDTVIVQRADNDDTRIVQRAADEHTRLVARARHARPQDLGAPDPAADPGDEATVRSSRGSRASDTLLSVRRTNALAPTPVVDDLQRRYQPPQVQSGSSVRYQARPAPIILAEPQPAAGPEPIAPDPARIALAEAAAEIRHRAAAGLRRRRRSTLVVIIASTLLALVAAVAFAVSALAIW